MRELELYEQYILEAERHRRLARKFAGQALSLARESGREMKHFRLLESCLMEAGKHFAESLKYEQKASELYNLT